MIKKNKIMAIIFFVFVALLFSLPVSASSSEEDQVNYDGTQYGTVNKIPFDQSMYVPGSTWVYNVIYDIHTDNIGKTIIAYFNSTEIVDNTVHTTFSMVTPTYVEGQLLSCNIFERKTNTTEISRSDMGMYLTFEPEIIHFDFPLYAGEEWEGTINYSGSLYEYPTNGIVNYRQKVLYEELVNTNAGSFNTIVIDSSMEFPAMGQDMTARLWMSDDGLLVKRDAYVNGVKVQEIELESYSVSVESMLNQNMLEVSLLKDEVKNSVPKKDAKKLNSILNQVQRNLRLEQQLLTQNNTKRNLKFLNQASIEMGIFIKVVASMKNLDPITSERLITGASVTRGHIDLIKENVK